MESLLENLVKHVGDNMPDMKVVDEDYGQLEALDQTDRDMYPLTFPAVLIEAPSVEWSNIGGLSQKGLATVRVSLIIDCYDDTHYTSGTVGKIAEREKIRRRLHEVLDYCKQNGNRVELLMKDNHTLGHNPRNASRWVEIAREEVAKVYG